MNKKITASGKLDHIDHIGRLKFRATDDNTVEKIRDACLDEAAKEGNLPFFRNWFSVTLPQYCHHEQYADIEACIGSVCRVQTHTSRYNFVSAEGERVHGVRLVLDWIEPIDT